MEPTQLRALIHRALADKVLTRAERQQLLNAIIADAEVSPEEHRLLELIEERLSSDEIQAVD